MSGNEEWNGGRPFKRYLVSYLHDGGSWNIEVPALSPEDARQRLGKLALGRLEGEIVAKVPGALGPIAAAVAFLQNAIARKSFLDV